MPTRSSGSASARRSARVLSLLYREGCEPVRPILSRAAESFTLHRRVRVGVMFASTHHSFVACIREVLLYFIAHRRYTMLSSILPIFSMQCVD